MSAYRGAMGWDEGVAGGAPPEPDVAARQERDAAHARLQAHAAGDPCQDFGRRDYDFDRCVTAVVKDPVLFQRQPSDADAIDSRDVNQGRLSDCYLLAPLAAMAGTPAGRTFLRNAIVENKHENGDVVSYTVTLHPTQELRPGMVTFHAVSITVDGPYVAGHAGLRPGGPQNEVWPLVVEKACAQYLRSYNTLGRASDPTVAMKLLTGQNATATSLDWPARWLSPYSEATLKSDLAKGKLVILSTRAEGGDASHDIPETMQQEMATGQRLVPGHAYFVTGTEQRQGKTFVRLGNPWPDSGPVLVPFDRLKDWFAAVSVGSLK